MGILIAFIPSFPAILLDQCDKQEILQLNTDGDPDLF